MALVRWLKDYLIDLALYVVPILFSITLWFTASDAVKLVYKTADGADSTIRIHWLLTSIALLILYVVVAVLYVKKRKRLSELELKLGKTEAENQKFREALPNMITGTLVALAQGALDFGYKERISLYVHDGNGRFVPIGRYSKNPEYAPMGRPYYPDQEGVISRAWRNGEAFFDNCPIPEDDLDTYLVWCQELNLPRRTANKLTMKSRLYYGKQIRDTGSRNPLAVIIVESEEMGRFQPEQLNAIFDGATSGYLSSIIEEYKQCFPDLKIAEKLGY